jgi:hypothetical protein
MQRKKSKKDDALVTKTVAVFLKYLREHKFGWSLLDATGELDLENPSTLSRIESGNTLRPRFALIQKMCEKYGFANWAELAAAAEVHVQTGCKDYVEAASIEVLPTTERAYERLCQVIKRLDRTSGIKEWFLGALHGVDERKRHPAEPQEEPPAQREFGRLLLKACNSVGQDRWRVQMVANLVHSDRLTKMEGLLNKTTNAIGFELKFVMLERSLSMLSPCILGNEDAFIGVQDIAYYRVQSVIHLRGNESNRWLRTHWDIIWGQAKWLRRATVLERNIIDKIKAAQSGDPRAMGELTG